MAQSLLKIGRTLIVEYATKNCDSWSRLQFWRSIGKILNKISKFLVGVWLIPLALSLACKQETKSSTTSGPEDSTNKPKSTTDDPINLTVAEDDAIAQLEIPATLQKALVIPENKKNVRYPLISQIKNKKTVSFSAITDLFLKKHLQMYDQLHDVLDVEDAPKYAEFRKKLETVENAITEKTDLPEMKSQIFKEIGITGKKSYNLQFMTVPNVILQKKLQCYSGTSTFEVIARDLLKAKSFAEKNAVILMLSGHILPGYMEKDGDGDWNLIGIETTTVGKSKITYGKAKKLGEQAEPMRVLDANLWMILEVLVEHGMDQSKIVEESLAITNKMYGNQIPVAELEEKIKNAADASDPGIVEDEVTTEDPEIGSFGKPTVEPGDQDMSEMDQISSDAPAHGGGAISPDARSYEAAKKEMDRAIQIEMDKIKTIASGISCDGTGSEFSKKYHFEFAKFKLICSERRADDRNGNSTDYSGVEGYRIGGAEYFECVQTNQSFKCTMQLDEKENVLEGCISKTGDFKLSGHFADEDIDKANIHWFLRTEEDILITGSVVSKQIKAYGRDKICVQIYN